MIELNIIIAFLTSLISLIIIRPFAVKYNLVDLPNERKSHEGNIPLVGGICIFLGLLIPYLILMNLINFLVFFL